MNDNNIIDAMFAASNLEGKIIDGWQVKLKLPRPDKSQGESGGNFSICYIVEKDGKEFFMKVLNYQNVVFPASLSGLTLPEYMERALKEFNYEKNLSRYCKDKKISKVVVYEASGEVELKEFQFPTVSYIVYEKANGNIRKFIEFSKKLEFSARVNTLSEKLRSLRDVATGLSNLHRNDITHQDLKPSNIMEFGNESKIGDLGRSLCFDENIECPYPATTFHGDWTYAPIEAIFGYLLSDIRERLYQMDNYTLGGLIAYYLTGMSFNALMNMNLPIDMLQMRKMGLKYEDVKIDLTNAFELSLQILRDEIPLDSIREDIVKIVEYLCNPNPEKRGHPINLSATNKIPNYDLQRTITELDVALQKAKLELLKMK